jgi:catechol 2,3-dioxygenase-like lactoylglutathione lyase family enzyme
MKIKELVLLTNNLEQTKDFYSAKMNLQVLKEQSDCIWLEAGATILVFKASEIANPVYHFAFNISNNKIEEALNWIEAKGLQLVCLNDTLKIIDFPNWNAKSLYFLDNNGNVLEFIARFDLKTESNLPFDEKHILSVSEIGMVVEDVEAYCQQVMEKYAIPYYEKQKPAPNFSVMGDAEGLLIVVPEHRHWFPTDIPSGRYPVDVVLESEGLERNIFLT